VKLLRIDSSPMGEAAISRQLTKEFVQRWLSANPQSTVIKRDLTTITIPVIDAAWVAANYTPTESRTHQQNELLKLSTEFITELLDADEYVMGICVRKTGLLPSKNAPRMLHQVRQGRSGSAKRRIALPSFIH
jgi:FMN-dependent NADH-azoreductase